MKPNKYLEKLYSLYSPIKLSSDTRQLSPEVDSELELQETKVALDIDPWHPEIDPELELQETKVALNPRQPSSEIVPFYKSRLLIGGGIASVLVILVAGYMTHRQSYLQAQGALEQIEALKRAEKYHECLQQARTFPKNHSNLHTEVQTHLHQCRQGQAQGQLAEAKELAEQRRFKDAIALAAKVPKDTDSYSLAQQLMTQWSEKIFQIANNKYRQGNFKEAVAIAGAVSADSPLATKMQAAIGQWTEEWNKDETHLQAAQKALDERHWKDAINAAKEVSQTDYWQKQTEPIIQKAEAKIAAAQAAASRAAASRAAGSSKTYQPRSRSASSRRFRSASSRRFRSTPSRSKSAPPRVRSAPPRVRSASSRSRSAPPRVIRSVPSHSRSAPPYRKLDKLR